MNLQEQGQKLQAPSWEPLGGFPHLLMQLRFMYRASIRKHWHEFFTMRRGAQECLELESQEATLLRWFLSCVWIWVGFKFPLCSISVCLLQMESFSVFHQDRCRCIKRWNQMLNSEGTTIILACYQVCKHEVGLAAKLNIATFVACYWHHFMRAYIHQTTNDG
jgi:hypothetical protein